MVREARPMMRKARTGDAKAIDWGNRSNDKGTKNNCKEAIAIVSEARAEVRRKSNWREKIAMLWKQD